MNDDDPYKLKGMTDAQLIHAAGDKQTAPLIERAAAAQAELERRRSEADADFQNRSAIQQRKFEAAQLDKQIEANERLAQQQAVTADKQLAIAEKQLAIAADQATFSKNAAGAARSSAYASWAALGAALFLTVLTAVQVWLYFQDRGQPVQVIVSEPITVRQP